MAKLSKSEADYVPHAKAEHCADCTMFRAFNGRCTLVIGAINDDGQMSLDRSCPILMLIFNPTTIKN